MREITLKVPDSKFWLFMELIKQLGLETSEKEGIPEEQMNLVRDRIKKSKENPERLLNWDQVQDNFKFD